MSAFIARVTEREQTNFRFIDPKHASKRISQNTVNVNNYTPEHSGGHGDSEYVSYIG